MKKTIMTTLVATVAAMAMSITAFAAGSAVGGIDIPNASADGGATVTLSKEVAGLYDSEIQQVVDAINNAHISQSLEDVTANLTMDDVERFDNNELKESAVNKDKYMFLSPAMNLTVSGADNGTGVTLVLNNMTKDITVGVLHYCEEHGWEILHGERIGENEVRVSFHSSVQNSPIAVVYNEYEAPSYGGGAAPWFGPTATPLPERDTTPVQPAATKAPTVDPAQTEESAEVEPTEAPDVESSEAPEESSEAVEGEPEATPTAEPDVPATAPGTGTGITIPVIIIAVVLVGLGIFFIIFWKRKKDEEEEA